MNHKIIWMFLLLFLSVILSGRSIVTLNEPLGPSALYVNNDHAFIQEGESILVYDLKDFKLKKKIGRKGAGPGEFKLVPYVKRLFIFFHKDKLQVCHLGRVSFFTLNGDYINEIRHQVMAGWARFYPLGSKYLAYDINYEKKESYKMIGIYDSSLNLEKVLLKIYDKEDLDKIKALKPLKYGTFEKLAFIIPSADFVINVYDEAGKKSHSIQKMVTKIPVSKEDKKYFAARYTNGTGDKRMGTMIADRLIFPDVFPAIRAIHLSQKKIYVLTYWRKGQNHQCFVFNLNGKQLKEAWVPFYNENPLAEMNFFTIKNGNVFQLVENEEEESWELHIDGIK